MGGIMLGPSLIAKGGISTVVNTYRQSGLFEKYAITYIPTTIDGNIQQKIFLVCKSLFQYLKILISHDKHFVHIHIASRNSTFRKAIFIFLSMAARKKYLLHLHGGEYQQFYETECGPIKKWVVRTIFDRASCVLVLSSQWQKTVSTFSANGNVIVVNNPVVMPTRLAAGGRQRGNIVFLGRLGSGKGIYDLIVALESVVKKFPQAQLYCGGDGEVAQVHAAVEKAGLLDNFHFLGWVDGEEKLALMQQADLYVLPSYNEGLPMGILEALSFGIPVISTPVGGIPDAIEDGKEGFLVAPGDTLALADRILRLLSDDELHRAMAENAHRKAREKFSVEHVIPQVEAIYDKL